MSTVMDGRFPTDLQTIEQANIGYDGLSQVKKKKSMKISCRT